MHDTKLLRLLCMFLARTPGFDVACSLGAMLTSHAISTFSHFESAEDKKDDRM